MYETSKLPSFARLVATSMTLCISEPHTAWCFCATQVARRSCKRARSDVDQRYSLARQRHGLHVGCVPSGCGFGCAVVSGMNLLLQTMLMFNADMTREHESMMIAPVVTC